MFTALSTSITNAYFNLLIDATKFKALTFIVPNIGGFLVVASPLAPRANCADPIVATIGGGIATITNILIGIGVAAGVIGIAVGGLMRATSFGNERRIAMSNTAITCAVIGMVTVLLSITLGNAIPGWFNMKDQACPIGPAVPANQNGN